MNKTPNLNLPIYNTPDVDVFDLQDWNNANIAVDDAYKQIIDFKEEIPKINPSAEVLEARGGEETLGIKINKIDTSLSQKTNISNKRIAVINNKTEEIGCVDVANFARQGLGLEPIGFIIHHYTEGDVIQIDNVGENNEILVLKNAKNPVRRTDKPEDFVGTGAFVSLKRHDNDLGNQVTDFQIDEGCNFKWFRQKTTTINHYKTDDGFSGFDLRCINEHSTPFRVLNGLKTVFNFICDMADKTRLCFKSGTSMVNGFKIEATQGNLDLTSTNGKVIINGGSRRVVQTCNYGTTEQRPTTPSIGEMYFDLSVHGNGKPIWWNGTKWIDSTGTQM